MSNGMRLLRRTALFPGESIPSFITRLAQLNYYSITELMSLFAETDDFSLRGSFYSLIYSDNKDLFLKLAEDCEVPRNDLLAGSYGNFIDACRLLKNVAVTREIGGHLTLAFSLRNTRKYLHPAAETKYCPLCLQGKSFHRLAWVPVALNICLDHHCLLSERCPDCYAKVSLGDVIDGCCGNCGTPLNKAEIIYIDQDGFGVNSQYLLARWFGCENEKSKNLELIHNLPLQNPAAAYHFIDGLYRCLCSQDSFWREFPSPLNEKIKKTDTFPHYQKVFRRFLLFRAAVSSLADWPHGLYRFIESYENLVLALFSENKKWQIWQILDVQQEYTHQHDVVKKGIVNYFLDRHICIPMTVYQLIEKESWFLEQVGLITKETACKILKFSTDDFERILGNPQRLTTRWGFYHYRDVLALKQELEMGWTLAEASNWLGLDKKKVEGLISLNDLSGIVSFYDPCRGYVLVNPESARSFYELLVANLSPVPPRSFKHLSITILDTVFGKFNLNFSSIIICFSKGLLPGFGNFCSNGTYIFLPDSLLYAIQELIISEQGFISWIRFAFEKGTPWRLCESKKSQLNSLIIEDEVFYDKKELDEFWKRILSMIIRPGIIDTETLDSYLSRLGKANFYEEANWAYQLISLPRGNHVNYVSDVVYLDKISEILNLSSADVFAMTVHRYAKQLMGKELWDEQGRSLFLSSSKALRVCPICYQETGAVLLNWLLRPVTACSKHRVLLMDTSSCCAQNLSDTLQCQKCGKTLTDTDIVPVDDDAGLLLITLVSKALNSQATTPFSDTDYPFCSFTSPEFFTMLLEIGNLILEYDDRNPRLKTVISVGTNNDRSRTKLRELEVQKYHQVMSAVVELFLNWPGNWYKMLERILAGEVIRRNGQYVQWKRRTFASELRKLISNIPNLQWLWKEFLRFAQHYDGSLPGINFWQKYITLDTHPKVEEKTVLPESHSDVPATSIDDETMDYRRVMEYLGVSRGSLKSMISAGLILPLDRRKDNSRQKWLFSRQHLDFVLNYLIGCTEVEENISQNIDFVGLNDSVPYVSQAHLRWIDILQLIHLGKIKAYRQPGLPGLQSIMVEKRSLKYYLEDYLSDKPMTIYQMANTLGCGIEMLIKLALSGLLVPILGYPGNNIKAWRYNVESVRKYKEKYALTKDAAEIVGVASRTLLSWVEKGWIKAVSGPDINGTHAYLFDRYHIIQWRYERIFSKELLEILGISQRTLESWLANQKITPMEDMPQHPYWFKREDVEKILAERIKKREKKKRGGAADL